MLSELFTNFVVIFIVIPIVVILIYIKFDSYQDANMTEETNRLAKEMGYVGFTTYFDYNNKLRIDTFHELFACRNNNQIIVLPLKNVVNYSSLDRIDYRETNNVSAGEALDMEFYRRLLVLEL